MSKRPRYSAELARSGARRRGKLGSSPCAERPCRHGRRAVLAVAVRSRCAYAGTSTKAGAATLTTPGPPEHRSGVNSHAHPQR